ncbi:tRNA uracil 4-sulfurtransferase ThiI [Marinobacter sp. CHS3-4]|uniref:tRNA uracil 4-sulfurtransferase ThiI n=1 Tax=Marinobacter sp. CHS3-4 TaxID=3045174 RepID=UPI0024B54E3E|nr:tRNA uracil 4-sulfurtransferase ThiI [Marinobacter sp. CHS3-4]MDI9244046.1 tRNA uracil 4-sulfurtransferase ThiI [Marinobacter sp. CHS3-4]
MKLLIRPAPEIAIKGKPVRRQQMRLLRQNIRKLLSQVDGAVQVQGSWDRVTVDMPDDENLLADCLEVLGRTPGISTIQEISEFPWVSLESVADQAVEVFGGRLTGQTFAVRVRRNGNQPFRSAELERMVGSALMGQCEPSGVDLKNPDVEVRIEVQNDYYHIAHRKHRGVGGYPLGSVETVMSLMSGGYDSSVAAYLMMRRGIRSHFLFFNLGGAAHEIGVRQVVHYIWERYGASHSAKFISVPFEGVVGEIMRSVNHRHWGVVLKRQMLKAAADIAGTNNASALVTGDAVAQVSSQTLSNLNVVDRACDQVVLRPLVSMDKEAIIEIARDIGTEPFARTMPEYCGVISRKPATRAKLHRVEADEAEMDPAVLAQAIENREDTPVDRLLETIRTPEDVELVRTPDVEDVIIDVRHPAEGEAAPLNLTSNPVMSIPFYELNERIQSLPEDQQYLLYCDRGTMSQMQACNLKAEGHDNIKVYAPVA